MLLTPALNVCLLVMLHLLLLRSGDVESNPGPFGEFVWIQNLMINNNTTYFITSRIIISSTTLLVTSYLPSC